MQTAKRGKIKHTIGLRRVKGKGLHFCAGCSEYSPVRGYRRRRLHKASALQKRIPRRCRTQGKRQGAWLVVSGSSKELQCGWSPATERLTGGREATGRADYEDIIRHRGLLLKETESLRRVCVPQRHNITEVLTGLGCLLS